MKKTTPAFETVEKGGKASPDWSQPEAAFVKKGGPAKPPAVPASDPVLKGGGSVM